MTTMVLGGLWHGASWNFVIWGAYQGGLLCVNRFIRFVAEKIPALNGLLQTKIGTAIRWCVTMYFVLLGWLIFRVTDFEHLKYCAKKFVFFDGRLELSALGVGNGDPVVAVLLTGMFVVFHTYSRIKGRIHDSFDRSSPYKLALVYATLAIVFFYLWPATDAAFIYFQF